MRATDDIYNSNAEDEEWEEVVEIDQDGKVYRPGKAPLNKKTILRDPEGEY